MLVGLEAHFKRLLQEVVGVSSGIRDTDLLDHANGRNFDIAEGLRHKLEMICKSADDILQAFTKASLTSYSFNNQIDDWLASEELNSCLGKLKEMNDILRPVPSPTPIQDKLTAAMAFFDNYKSFFHFCSPPIFGEFPNSFPKRVLDSATQEP